MPSQEGSSECPEGDVAQQTALAAELLRLHRPAPMAASSTGASGLLEGLLAALQPASSPASFAPMRAAALRAVTRDLYAAMRDAEPALAAKLLMELMKLAARDADVECQRSARTALGELPLGSADLAPLLGGLAPSASSGGRKKARTTAAASGVVDGPPPPSCIHTMVQLAEVITGAGRLTQ